MNFPLKLNENLKYQEESPYLTSGFLNNLSPPQEASLKLLLSWVNESDEDILTDLSLFALHPVLTLLRYLRANSFNTEKTKVHISKNLKYRKEMGVNSLMSKTPEYILGVKSMSDLTEMFPHWHCGFDNFGRPVLYKQYGRFNATELFKITSLDAVLKYHLWEQEACMELCILQSKKLGFIVETITAVIDIKGMKISQVNSDFLAIVKGIANIDQAQYPETLGRFFIINAPSVFPFVWRGVKAFLDPVVTSKIHIFSNESEWKPKLLVLLICI